MSNGIYNILGKLQALEPKQEQPAAPAQPLYESVEAKGSILEGVAKVEKELNEKYMGFKAVEKAAKAGGAKDPAAVAAAVGRKKYGKEKFQKAAAAGKKLGEGKSVTVNGKEVDVASLEVDGINHRDAPEFTDAYFSSGMFADGTPMSEVELDRLQDENPDLLYDRITARIYEAKKAKKDYDHDGKIESPKDEVMGSRMRAAKKAGRMEEGTQETPTGRVHKGTYGTEFDVGDDGTEKKKKPAATGEKRGRGRPKKDVNANKYDWSAFGATGKKVKLPPHKGTVTKHTLDEEDLDEGILDTLGLSQDAKAKAAQEKASAEFKARKAAQMAKQQHPLAPMGKTGMKAAQDAWSDPTYRGGQHRGALASEGTEETPTGRVHKGTYGREFDTDREGNPIVKKPAATGEKRGRGRPKKDVNANKYDWSAFGGKVKLPKHTGPVTRHTIDETTEELGEKAPPGAKAERMVKDIKKSYAKDGKLTGREKAIAYATAWKAHKAGKVEESMISESVLQDHSGNTLRHIVNTYRRDIKDFLRDGEPTSELWDALFDYYSPDMPYGTAKARTGDPVEWVYERLNSDLERMGMSAELEEEIRPEMIPAVQRKAAGKNFPVTKQQLDAPGDNLSDIRNLGGDTARKMAAQDSMKELDELARLAGINVAESCDPMMAVSPEQNSRMNISTNSSSDGTKNVTVSAEGDAAEALLHMLKIAGLDGNPAARERAAALTAEPDSGSGIEVEVDEAEGQYANTPDEEYRGVDSIIDQGDDMNRQKKQFADKPKTGDNPMATAEIVDPIANLGRDLMQEYEAMKIRK